MIMGETRRPDLRRWLEMMVRERRCQGLTWEDEEQKLFRLPWPHQKSRDWKEEDCQILIEWAKHTGKYKQGDPVEFPTWKTRIRTAINKNKEIKEVPNLHRLEGSNPYKVYRFLSTSPSRTRRGQPSPPHSGNTTCTSPSPLVNEVFGQFFMSEVSQKVGDLRSFQQLRTSSSSSTDRLSQFLQKETIASQTLLAGSNCTIFSPQNIPTIISESNASPTTFANDNNILPFDVNSGQSSTEEMDTSDNVQISLMTTTQNQFENMHVEVQTSRDHSYTREDHIQASDYTDGQSHTSENASIPSDLKSIDSLDLYRLNTDSIPTKPDSIQTKPDFYMHVQVLYGPPSQIVNSSRVKSKCCRLFFGSPNSSAGQETTAAIRDEIQMPDFSELPHFDEKQKRKINEALFENEGGEVILTYSEDGDVYAERRCRTRVFFSDGVKESEVVPRTKKNRPVVTSKVFDYTNKFSSELKMHIDDPKNPLPRDHFVLTFGHEILKNDDFPLRVVPVFVVVRHVKASFERGQFTNATIGNALISADSSSFEKDI